ncbi:unnamed protein product, partial [Effrenium voratum]
MMLLRVLVAFYMVCPADSTAALRTSLQKVNDLLSVSESIHRAFKNEFNQQLADITVADGRICAKQTFVAVTSRQNLEDSWNTLQKLGNMEAMFNAEASCFMKYAGQCESYATCATSQHVFNAQDVPREGLYWAANHTKVEAAQLEQLALLDILLSEDDSTELAQSLRSDLQGAAGAADSSIQGLQKLLEDRVASFTKFVSPATAPTPQAGAAALPASLQSLATDLDILLQAAQVTDANCGGWGSSAQDVASELDGQDVVVDGIDASQVMQLSHFDYLRRAVEALVVGSSLALQVAAFANLAEFNCAVKHAPRVALVSLTEVGIVQDAANGVLTKLLNALPPPTVQDASEPLRRCLAERLQDTKDRLPQASEALAVSSTPLLSLDFCGRLFNATARELLSVVPYGGDVPFTSPEDSFGESGELRKFSEADGLAFVSPFADYVTRTGTSSSFTTNDQVIQLRAVAGMQLREANTPVEVACDYASMLVNTEACGDADCALSCALGCYRPGSCPMFGFCETARQGSWGDGETLQVCDTVSGQHVFTHMKWTNSSCPFVCLEADKYPAARVCESTTAGYWSPACNNSLLPCDAPAGMSASGFGAVGHFTSPGGGAADGCEITMAFPAARPFHLSLAVATLTPPFTVELFVNMTLDAIPVGESSSSSIAVLCGSFPSWYVALRRVSSGQAQIVFYHSRITLASHISAEDSSISSGAFSWDNSREPWRHLAVVVVPNVATQHNVFFYVDSVFVSSGYRSISATDIVAAPNVEPSYGVFHVGPVNIQRFPALLSSGRPYYDLPMFTAQLDEVRVHQEALDGLTLGWQVTELRRLSACNTPYEQRDGSACHAPARLTPPNTTLEQSVCRTGYEECGAMPGVCMEVCPGNLLRQADCSCDCPPAYFQTWLASAVHLTGSGQVKNATVYDAEHQILGQLGTETLPRRIALPGPSQVALVSVWGGGTASSVSLEVETPAPESQRLLVPELWSSPLQADRPTLLHHRAALGYDDPTLRCAQCPGAAPRSVLPRKDAIACRCAEGYGANLLGKCVPELGPLQAPVINLANGSFHTAGTRVRLSFMPGLEVEGPWLLTIRYEYGTFPNAPNCDTSPKYEESGDTPGLDIIRRQESVTVRAVACHPMHQISLETRVELFGNDHMNPPRCEVVLGNLSTDTTYAEQLQVALVVDTHTDATIFYELQTLPLGSTELLSGSKLTYSTPLLLATPGTVTISFWAEKLGFDTSSRSSCSFAIDGAARRQLILRWEDSPLQGFSSSESAFLVPRDLSTLAFVLEVPGVSDLSTFELQTRLHRGSLGTTSWTRLPSAVVQVPLDENLEAPNKTTLLQVDWRLKEPGYVWTSPGSLRVLVVRTRTEAVTISGEPVVLWNLGDSWTEGLLRDIALKQTHRVQLVQPNPSARVLFYVQAGIGQPEVASGPLLAAKSSNFSSLSTGFLERFRSGLPAQLPEEMPTACGGAALLQAVEVPKLCDYLGPFEVLGGAVVTAYAIIAGQLESVASSLLLPKELPPSQEDLSFQAPAQVDGSAMTISEEQVQVLPSTATSMTFSVGHPDAERQSCVLATPYGASPATLHACSWLFYNGPRKLYLENLMREAGLEVSAAVSLNVTVLTTVRRPGYLWSYPIASSFLWLREQTPVPQVVQVLEPGAAAPAAMVWLQAQEGNAAECYFTLHYETLRPADVPSPFLVEVPALTATVDSLSLAFRPTSRHTAALKADAWSADLELCAWPAVCVLPMNGTLPTLLVQAPAGYSRLCAWALWQGYLESAPACKLLGSGQTVAVEPSFVAEADVVPDRSDVVVPQEAGWEPTLRAQLLRLRGPDENSTSGRRLGAQLLPLVLPRTHPLQWRVGTSAVDARVLLQPGLTQSTLTADMEFSAWQDLALEAAAPLLPLPSRQTWDHILMVVDVRLLTGVDRWSAEVRSAALLMTGMQPSLSVQWAGRSILLETRANSTIYFKWLEGTAVSTFGEELIQTQADINSVADAFAVNPAAMLHPSSDPSLCTVYETSDASKQRELCQLEGSLLELALPSDGRWTLWAVSSGQGLGAVPVTFTVEAMCHAPQHVAYAATVSCAEGAQIESGAVCSAACQPGYVASTATLQCDRGQLAPSQFACAEESCAAPWNVSFSAQPCLEGSTLAPGGICTTQCESGYTPSESTLSCSRGRLTPSAFLCAESACPSPDVMHAISPSCSGLASVKSRETCIPQCQDGYAASEELLYCNRGRLDPEVFVCEPGFPVDVGVVIASVPSALLAGSLALITAYCFMGKTAEEEKPAPYDPLQEWWQCVQEVEPGTCVFCGKQPEELETRYEDHGPATLFR